MDASCLNLIVFEGNILKNSDRIALKAIRLLLAEMPSVLWKQERQVPRQIQPMIRIWRFYMFVCICQFRDMNHHTQRKQRTSSPQTRLLRIEVKLSCRVTLNMQRSKLPPKSLMESSDWFLMTGSLDDNPSIIISHDSSYKFDLVMFYMIGERDVVRDLVGRQVGSG